MKSFTPLRAVTKFVSFCLFSALSSAQAATHVDVDIDPSGLFQNQFLTFSSDSSLLCQEDAALSLSFVRAAIDHYEKARPGIAPQALAYLTSHTNPLFIAEIDSYRRDCRAGDNPEICVLTKYWQSEETALRVLAIFYDTGFKIIRGNRHEDIVLSAGQLRLIERGIRRLPVDLRRKMLYVPNDGYSKALVRGMTTLEIEATTYSGMNDRNVSFGEVSRGTNLMSLNPAILDMQDAGARYSNLNLAFIKDFRLDVVLHEFGHVVDFLFAWDGQSDQNSLFVRSTFLSLSSPFQESIAAEHAATWPTNWWSAYISNPSFANGRYEPNNYEKFAEMFAQYMLIPQDLKKTAPQFYAELKANVFNGLEYQGFEKCGALTRPLSYLERKIAPKINPDCDMTTSACRYGP